MFLPRLVSFSIRLLKVIYNAGDALLTGFWLGVLSEKTIYRYNDIHYDNGTSYINDAYNLSGLQRWEYDRIKNHLSKAKTFLIIGAGGGRETAALRKWGAEVDSYDCSEKLVKYANDLMVRNNIDAKIKYLPKNTVPEEIKKYDGIIIGWGAYSHIQGRENRIAFLSSLLPFCSGNTHLMISFLLKDGAKRKDNLTKCVANFFRSFSKRQKAEPGDRLLSYYAHFFDKSEIEKELFSSGFNLIEYYDIDYGCAVGKALIC